MQFSLARKILKKNLLLLDKLCFYPETDLVFRLPAGYKFGKFTVCSMLGRGGFGYVYLAIDDILHRKVALKTLTSASTQDLERFEREAKLCAKLSHPSIVQVYEIGKIDRTYYISMQYVEGHSLDDIELDLEQSARAIQKLCCAVDHAHMQGIIHRDIKPSNVLIDKNENVYLTDFGLAKQIQPHDKSMSLSGTIAGTPSFISPEQARGNTKDIDHLTDIYSIGATLYYLITKREPFRGSNTVEIISNVIKKDLLEPSTLNKKIPREIDSIIIKAMHKDKKKRYQSAIELSEDLIRYLKGEEITAKPLTFTEKLVRRIRRRKFLYVSLFATIFVLLIILVVVFWRLSITTEEIKIAMNKLREASRRIDKFDNQLFYPPFDITKEFSQLDEAVKIAEEVAAKKAAGEWAYYEIGRALRRMNRLILALGHLNQAVAISRQSIFLYERAWINLELYNQELIKFSDGTTYKQAAVNDLHEFASSKTSSGWQLEFAKCLIDYLEGRLEQALETCNILYSKVDKAHQADISRLKGNILTDLKRYDQAIEAYISSWQIKRCFYGTYLAAARAAIFKLHKQASSGLLDTTYINTVSSAAQISIEINPGYDLGYLYLGYAQLFYARNLLNKGDNPTSAIEKALQAYNKSLEINPDLPLAISHKALLYSMRAQVNEVDPIRDFEIAIKEATEASEKQKLLCVNLASVYVDKADFLLKQGKNPTDDAQKAIEAFRHMISISPTIVLGPQDLIVRSTAYILIADYKIKNGSDATNELKTALELASSVINQDSNNLQAWLNSAKCHELKRSFQKAIEQYTQAIKINSSSFNAYESRGDCYYQLEDSKKAKSDWLQAISLNRKLAPKLRPKIDSLKD